MKHIIFLVTLLVTGTFIGPAAAAAAEIELEGYAWASTIGWISMNCDQTTAGTNTCASAGGHDYSVSIDTDTNLVTGHAWSPNVGWIQFGGLSGFPNNGIATAQQNVTAVGTVSDSTDFTLEGWARACAGTANGDCSTMVDSGNTGGWDGWISMSGETVSSGGPVTPPTMGSYDISAATYEGVAVPTNQEQFTNGMLYNNDGTILYVLGGYDFKVVNTFILSVPYDISTASYSNEALRYNGVPSVNDIIFNDDGTVLYGIDSISDNIFAHTLSTPYDVSSAGSQTTVFNVGAHEAVALSMMFANSGTTLYVSGQASDSIQEYSLAVAYDISTASHVRRALDLRSRFAVIRDMLFNDDGSVLYVMGNDWPALGDIYSYNLSTPFDVSTASGEAFVLSVDNREYIPMGIIFNNDGSRLYLTGTDSDRIHSYNLGTVSGPPPPPPPGDRYGVTFVNGEAVANSFAWGGSNTVGWIDFSPDFSGVQPVTLKPEATVDIVIDAIGTTLGAMQPDGTYDTVTLTPIVTGIPDGVPVDWDLFVDGVLVENGTVTGNGLNPTYDRAIQLTNVLAGTPLAVRFEVDMPVADSQVTEIDEINRQDFTLNLSYPPPVITFSGTQVIRFGEQVDITATVTAPYDITCSFVGPGFLGGTVVVSGGTGTATERSSPLQNATRFEVSCTPGTDVYTEVYQVEVIPTFQEV